MKTAANRWLAIIDRISFFGSHLTGVVFLSAIVVLVTLEVILRYLFNTSTMLADEFSTYLFVGLLYFGSAYALQKDRHIKINIFVSRLSPRYRHSFSRFVAVLNMTVTILLSWRGWNLAVSAFQHNTLAATVMATPLFIPMLIVPLGLTILAIQAVAEVVRVLVVPGRSPTTYYKE